jgi:MFS family permease
LYAQDFFALLGTKGSNEKLFATAIFGVVKFVSAIACALFLVDIIGRKRSLFIGITLQAVSMVYVASYLTAVPDLDDENKVFTTSERHAGTGAIVMIYLSGAGWAIGLSCLTVQIVLSLTNQLSQVGTVFNTSSTPRSTH